MLKKHLLILICLFAGAVFTANAEDRTIKGVVISSEDKQPLIGVSVYVSSEDLKNAGLKQRVLGTTTDLDGSFTIKVPEQIRRIYCSYIGCEDLEVVLQMGKSRYDIVLRPSANKLADVVVTGYQTLERRKLTAAISKVEVSDALVGASKSIDQALSGQVAGVAVTATSGAPGAPARIRIRGTASLNGTQDPLWVLDGIPLEGTDIPKLDKNGSDNDINNISQSSIAGLSPNDIENITILKDAAATAIYGARAANGVIVITTKRGKSGKPVINYNTKLSLMPTPGISRLNLLNSEEKVNLELQLLKETYELFGDVYPSYREKGGVASILNKHSLMSAYRTGGWDALPDEVKKQINALKTTNTDWNDILFRNAFTHEHNFSISGGSENITYYNSFAYSKENGNIPGVSMGRFNLTSKTSYQLNKWLKLGAAVFANRRKNKNFVTDSQGYSNPVFYSRTANPYQKPFDDKHNYIYDYDISSSDFPDPKRGFNIFEERNNTSHDIITTAVNTIFDAQLKFNEDWKLSSQIGFQWDNAAQEKYIGMNSFSMRNIRENSIYGADKKYLIPEGGMHSVTQSTTSQITWKVQGEYKKTFKRIHDLQIMAGSEIRKNWFVNLSSTVYGYDPKTLTSKNLIFKDEAQANRFGKLHTKNYVENAFASFYANGSYSLMDRYTFGASVRLDGSDLFGVDKKYRYLPIYSFSGLWRISNERFLLPVAWMDNLAIRASYGLQGNIDKSTSPFLIGQYDKSSILPGYTEDNIRITSAPNSKLRWEKTASVNLGLDFAVLNQAINLSVDYYYRKGTDLIGVRMLPLENGFNSMNINWASMENKGVEINLQTRNITTKNFSWYTSFNFAYNQNKVLKVMTPENQTMPSVEGYPVGAIFALQTNGVNPENGRINVVGKDGKNTTLEELYKLTDEFGLGLYASGVQPKEERGFYKYMGTSDAPFSGGFMNTFNYKNWELNINFIYNFGAHVRTAPTYSLTNYDPGRNTNRDILQRWTQENKNGKYPALITRNNFPADFSLLNDRQDIARALDIWVKPVSYVRLQNIRLAYRLPVGALQFLHIKGATLAVEARNVFVFGTSYKNYLDPESMSNIYATPLPKMFTFNVNINF